MASVKLVSMAVAIASLAGCSSESNPTAPPLEPPSIVSQQPADAEPAFHPDFPAPSNPDHIYNEAAPLYDFLAPSQGKAVSRFVFYKDGTFSLQFSNSIFGFFEYKGTYAPYAAGIDLEFNDGDLGGAWNATGILTGNSLQVNYNPIMIGADFNNGRYVESVP